MGKSKKNDESKVLENKFFKGLMSNFMKYAFKMWTKAQEVFSEKNHDKELENCAWKKSLTFIIYFS